MNTINSTIIYLNNSGIRYCAKLEPIFTAHIFAPDYNVHLYVAATCFMQQISPPPVLMRKLAEKPGSIFVGTTPGLYSDETIDKFYVKQQVKWLYKSETIVAEK